MHTRKKQIKFRKEGIHFIKVKHTKTEIDCLLIFVSLNNKHQKTTLQKIITITTNNKKKKFNPIWKITERMLDESTENKKLSININFCCFVMCMARFKTKRDKQFIAFVQYLMEISVYISWYILFSCCINWIKKKTKTSIFQMIVQIIL